MGGSGPVEGHTHPVSAAAAGVSAAAGAAVTQPAMAHISFSYQNSLAPSSVHPQFMTSSPATSPNISVSGSNMSPICSEEGPSVSPPLPPRVPASLGGMERVMPTSLASSTMPDSSQFLPDPSSLAQHL